jgi:hypothetical protein
MRSRTGALEALISPVFDRIANTFVDAFVRRAEQVMAPADAWRCLSVTVALQSGEGRADEVRMTAGRCDAYRCAAAASGLRAAIRNRLDAPGGRHLGAEFVRSIRR